VAFFQLLPPCREGRRQALPVAGSAQKKGPGSIAVGPGVVYVKFITYKVNSSLNQINTSPGQSFSNASPKISGLPGEGELATAAVAPQYSHIPTMHPLEGIGGCPVSIRVTRNSPIL
jgi:hypothetical protein